MNLATAKSLSDIDAMQYLRESDMDVIIFRAHQSLAPRRPAVNANLSAVGIAQAYPGVAHLLVMHHRVVDLDVEAEPLHRQCADRREQGV
jgi:hypothetical protein